MRELSDAEIEAMSPEQKAEYARAVVAAKYHNPHLDREGDGGNRRTLFQGLAIAGAVVVAAGFVWAVQTRTPAEVDETRDRIAEQSQFGNIHKAHNGANKKR